MLTTLAKTSSCNNINLILPCTSLFVCGLRLKFDEHVSICTLYHELRKQFHKMRLLISFESLPVIRFFGVINDAQKFHFDTADGAVVGRSGVSAGVQHCDVP